MSRTVTVSLVLASLVALTACPAQVHLGDVGPTEPCDCCAEFSPGANLRAADFGLADSPLGPKFFAFAQGASDMTAASAAMVAETAVACRDIALALGASPNDPSAFGKSGRAAVTGWCALAKTHLEAQPAAKTGMGIARWQVCTPSEPVRADCARSCAADIDCIDMCNAIAFIHGTCPTPELTWSGVPEHAVAENLPLLMHLRQRENVVVNLTSQVVRAGAAIGADSNKLGERASACATTIASSVSEAAEDLSVSMRAAAAVCAAAHTY